MTHPSAADVVALYEEHAAAFDGDRPRTLFEQPWLDRFSAGLPAGGAVLDLGCGAGEPIAAHLIERGFMLTGIDSAPSLIALCRQRFPKQQWHVGDMRKLALKRRFDGILGWDSLFHLTGEAQRAMFPRFAAHARPGCMLMFCSGPGDGEAIGSYRGRDLYHASLAPEVYRDLLARNGFSVVDHRAEDRECGGRTIWLARHENTAPPS